VKTENGVSATFSLDEMKLFITQDPPESFRVKGVPFSANTNIIREILDTLPK
jgi:hypothetical protein